MAHRRTMSSAIAAAVEIAAAVAFAKRHNCRAYFCACVCVQGSHGRDHNFAIR